MKKITAFTIAAIMALGMTACAGDKDKPAEEPSSDASSASQEEKSSTSLSEEEILKKANGCAKTGFNAVAEYLADMETQGRISEATEQEALEHVLKELENNCDINGTVGVRFDDTEDSWILTVQFRSADKPEIVGQYPEPPHNTDECPAWSVNAEGECSASETADTTGENGGKGLSFGDALGDALSGGYVSKSKLRSANANAKTGYNAVAEYLTDMEVEGKISEATEQEAAEFAAKVLEYGGEGIVGVKFVDIEVPSSSFIVLWRASKNTDIIGRYPEPPQSTDECPEWDVGTEVSYSGTSYDEEEDK